MIYLSKYIHLNPVSSGLVKKADEYPWSSYQDYMNTKSTNLVDTSFLIKVFESQYGGGIEGYRCFVKKEEVLPNASFASFV